MNQPVFTITFQYALDGSSIIVPLTAEVQGNPESPFYVVQNFHTQHHREGTVLPAVEIKRLEGFWVHRDSEKESLISQAIGLAIDRKEASDKDSLTLQTFADTDPAKI
ncbi:hypothetical protein ACX0G9_25760 [Flavitalea flava]